MEIAHLEGVDLAYEVDGATGDPTVLVHGSLSDHGAWDRLRPLLASSLVVVAYDRRGFGLSTPGPRAHPVATDAEDLAALLVRLDLYPVHVIAHSYGGPVALRLAAQRPELVRSLLLHEAPVIGLLGEDARHAGDARILEEGIVEATALVHAGRRREAARAVVDTFSTTPDAWERLPPSVQDGFTQRMDRWLEEYADPESLRPADAALGEVLVPVLLTAGSLSPSWLKATRAALAARLPNATEVDVPGAGHAPHVTNPVEFAGLVLSFLLERNVPTH